MERNQVQDRRSRDGQLEGLRAHPRYFNGRNRAGGLVAGEVVQVALRPVSQLSKAGQRSLPSSALRVGRLANPQGAGVHSPDPIQASALASISSALAVATA